MQSDSRLVRRVVFALSVLSMSAGCIVVEPASDSVAQPTPTKDQPPPSQTGVAPSPSSSAPAPGAKPMATTTRFGVAAQWSQSYDPPSAGPANVDAVVVGDWLLENGFTSTHQTKLGAIVAKKKTPYMFGYILTAMTKKGLGDNADCDGDPTRKLCQQGADWVRSHIEGDILPAYVDAATKIGTAAAGGEVLIHVEPDYLQFSEKAQTHPLSHDESNGFMNKILAAIHAGCPSCKVVADFSPWFSPDKTTWAKTAADFYSGWDRTVLKYVGITGKQFPYTEGKIDNFTYAEMSQALGLPLVVIDAYTFGGASIDVDVSWLDKEKLVKMHDMGIAYLFLSQQGDVAGYDKFLASQ